MAKDSKNDEAWNKQIEYMTNEIRKEENKNHDLQQRIDEAVEWCEYVINCKTSSGMLPNGVRTDMGYCLDLAEPLLKILKGDDTNES